jgi:DNA polymerase-2
LLAKTFQETLYQLVFTEQPVADYISETVNNIREGKLDAQLVYTKQLRKPLAEYTKSVPPHVKAAKQADEQNQSLGKQLQYQKRTAVRYVITTGGPQVPEYQTHPLDYDHYIEKQIRPIADSILPTIGESFDAMASQQIGLF